MPESKPVVDFNFLQALVDTPEPPKATRTKKPKDVRDMDGWFKNPNVVHILNGTCSQGDDCLGKILYNKGPGRVTAIVNDVEMCRICFLDGLAYNGE